MGGMIQKNTDGYSVRVANIPNETFTIVLMYVHLTAHSAFSLQEGLMTPADLVYAAHVSGMSALGLTDHHLLTGAVEFVKASREVGIQPILGLEIDLEQGSLQLLATSVDGWSNLCRLSSTLALRDNPDLPCSLEMLFQNSKGLIALSENPQGLQDGFEDRLYISLRNATSARSLSEQARKLGLPTVVAHPVYYQNPEQVRLQKTLAAIRLSQTVTTIPQHALAPTDAWFMPSQMIEERFREFPDASRKRKLYSGLFVLLKLKLTLPFHEFKQVNFLALQSFRSLLIPVRTPV